MNPNNSNKVNSYFNPGAGNSLTDAHTSNNKQPSITNSRFRSNPPRPYPRTDFSFLNSNSNLVKDPSKPAPNIYGKTNSNHLLKTSKLNINHQKNESHQSEREKFFAEYIKNNGDAASQIIPNFLYIGGHKSVINVPNLLTDKVTHVLNMAGELNLDFVEMDKCNIKLLNVLAKDSKNYNIRKDFDLTFQFIDDCLRSRGKIIVNCARGISRSGTIVIAYLMFRYSMSLMEAYNLITSLRPQVRPNSYFRKQLETYENELAFIRFKAQLKDKQNTTSSCKSTKNQFLASFNQLRM